MVTSLSPRDNFYYLVAWQALRCAALLHDIGHPPFCHVIEEAINELRQRVEESGLATDRVKEFRACFDAYDLWHAETGKKLHEWITVSISQRAFETLRASYKNEDDLGTARFKFFVYCATNLAMEILNNRGVVGKALAQLIDGCVDCDRLDFVLRDLTVSGMGCNGFNLERLILSTRLRPAPQRSKKQSDAGKFVFTYDVRAISIIENFLSARLYIYKYLICHHRVVKTDIMLRSVVVDLSLEYLRSKTKVKLVKGNLLKADISGLWQALELVSSTGEYFEHLLQWVDSWLISILRVEYFSTEDHMSSLHKRLEELVANRKNYYSIIKRHGDFHEIEARVEAQVRPVYEELLSAKVSTCPKLAEIVESRLGFRRCSSVLRELAESKHHELVLDDFEFETIVESSARAAIKTQCGDCDVLFQFKEVNSGMAEGKIPYVTNGKREEPLADHSTIEDALAGVVEKRPIFYAYIDVKCTDFGQLRESIGDAIAAKMNAVFQEALIQIKPAT